MVPPFILSAVVYASLFGLMAIGLTLTYLTTKVPNFAYGSFMTVGLYTSYTLFKVNKWNPYETAIPAFLLTGLISVVMYLTVLKPLAKRGSPVVSLMIATFAVDIGFTGMFGIYTDYLTSRYHLIDTKSFYAFPGDFAILGLQGIDLVAPLVLGAITATLFLVLTRTRFGVAMRAAVENPPLARILGINTERVYIISWMIAGGLAGTAGALYSLFLPGGTSTGSDVIVEIFASSVLGGLSSIFGAVLGGVVIGGTEIILGTYLAIGFGPVGAGMLGVLSALAGALVVRGKSRSAKAIGAFLIVAGADVVLGVTVGTPAGILGTGLQAGFGVTAIAYLKGIPLMIMVLTLLVLPKGLVSIRWRKLAEGLRRKRQ